MPFGRKSGTSSDEDIQIGTPSPAWMLTYSDLVTQLLIFFVMMFALAAAMNEMQLVQLKKRLETYVREQEIEDTVGLVINEKGLVISLREKGMFDSGKAEIYEDAKKILQKITAEVIIEPNDLSIEGHTDNVPIHTERFPTNWELSTARSTNVLRYLIEVLRFPTSRIAAGGYGEYQPVERNDTPDHRAKNRRVDIVIKRIGSSMKKAVTVSDLETEPGAITDIPLE